MTHDRPGPPLDGPSPIIIRSRGLGVKTIPAFHCSRAAEMRTRGRSAMLRSDGSIVRIPTGVPHFTERTPLALAGKLLWVVLSSANVN